MSTSPNHHMREWSARFVMLWNLLSKPDESIRELGQQQRARLLAMVSLATVLWALVALLIGGTVPVSHAALIIVAGVSYGFSRSRRVVAGSYVYSYGILWLAVITLSLGVVGSLDAALILYAVPALIGASALLSSRGFVLFLLVSILAAFAAPYYSAVATDTGRNSLMTAGAFTFMGLVLIGVHLSQRLFEEAWHKDHADPQRELAETRTHLENRVRERTIELDLANQQMARRAIQLQTITELSESIALLKDLNELLPAVTRLVSERFGFYHVGIFLLDSDRSFAVLHAANSPGGIRMLERQHRLGLGTGVVGFAAQTGQARIALDVGRDAVFFNNPDLPETRSEVALPLKSGAETIGVLDVQSTQAGAFSHEDLQVLTALANQVAISIENARLLTETRAALSEVQHVYHEFTRAEWSKLAAQTQHPGFRYQAGQVRVLEKPLRRHEIEQAIDRNATVQSLPNSRAGRRSTVVVPVRLRGQVIGILHIETSESSAQWRDDEVRLIEAVAERAALAMENARLFQDARRRAAKERLISEATSRISSALSIENILYATAEELERVLGGSEVVIQFQNSEQK